MSNLIKRLIEALLRFFTPKEPTPVTIFDFKDDPEVNYPTSDEMVNYLFRAEAGYHPPSTELLSSTDYYYWVHKYMTFVIIDGTYYGKITDLGTWYLDDYLK